MNTVFVKWLLSFIFTLVMSVFILIGTFQLGYQVGEEQTQRIALAKGHGYLDEKGGFHWMKSRIKE